MDENPYEAPKTIEQPPVPLPQLNSGFSIRRVAIALLLLYAIMMGIGLLHHLSVRYMRYYSVPNPPVEDDP